MNYLLRKESILNATCLDEAVTGYPSFSTQKLELSAPLEFTLPNNLRLGHLVEKTVVELFRASDNYSVQFDNIQLVENGKTIGELDLIVQEKTTQQLTHVEIAYKFYLFDPEFSTDPIKNWIGPNRNDTLSQKLEKLKTRQFPLLFHPQSTKILGIDKVAQCHQATCFMAHLFVPRDSNHRVSPDFAHAIKGDYVTFEQFFQLNHSGIQYLLPEKTEWGTDPKSATQWSSFDEVYPILLVSEKAKRSLLCWQKEGNHYSTFFIVWW